MTSICIYGSVARHNQDVLSDKDALILFDGSDACRTQGNKWKSKGWSVATYTPQRLHKMADAGSLFVQHLKQEGLIVSDSGQVLSDILAGYSPKSDYSADIDQSVQALRLLEHVPEGLPLQYWSADLLYILIRNLGILRLANEGVYEFSFTAIAERLRNIEILNTNDIWVFAELRKAKSCYRSRQQLLHPILNVIEAALFVIEKICGVAIQRSHDLSFSSMNYDQAYFSIRQIEKEMLILNPNCREDGSRNAVEDLLWKIITDPRAYSWTIRSKQIELMQCFKSSIRFNENIYTKRGQIYCRKARAVSAVSKVS